MHAAFNFITNHDSSRAAWRVAEEGRMKIAAGALAFEQAARIKQRLERARLIDTDPYTHMAPLRDFGFLALQPGQGRTNIEPWWIHAGHVECWSQFKKKDIATAAPTLPGACAEKANEIPPVMDVAGMEQIGLVAHHLFRGEREPGVYLRNR